jgi:hypothetical protein
MLHCAATCLARRYPCFLLYQYLPSLAPSGPVTSPASSCSKTYGPPPSNGSCISSRGRGGFELAHLLKLLLAGASTLPKFPRAGIPSNTHRLLSRLETLRPGSLHHTCALGDENPCFLLLFTFMTDPNLIVAQVSAPSASWWNSVLPAVQQSLMAARLLCFPYSHFEPTLARRFLVRQTQALS